MLIAGQTDRSTPPFMHLTGGVPHVTTLDSSKIHYLTMGKGAATLVFVHGWACNLHIWRDQASFFARRAKLILVDLPGHGLSDKPETAYSFEFLALAVAAVLREEGVRQAVCIGHSMGAGVLCHLYRLMPDMFAGLVSIDGLLRRPPGTAEQARLFINQFLAPGYPALARRYFKRFFPVPGTETLRDSLIAEMLTTPQHVIASEAEQIASLDLPDWALDRVGVPLLVLNAPGPYWSSHYVRYVQSLSAAVDYQILEGTGHFLMLEKPGVFNDMLADQLEQFDLL